MSDSLERSTKINLLRESVVKKLCEVLDKSSNKGWRKLGEIVASDRRFKVRYVDDYFELLCNFLSHTACMFDQISPSS